MVLTQIERNECEVWFILRGMNQMVVKQYYGVLLTRRFCPPDRVISVLFEVE